MVVFSDEKIPMAKFFNNEGHLKKDVMYGLSKNAVDFSFIIIVLIQHCMYMLCADVKRSYECLF